MMFATTLLCVYMHGKADLLRCSCYACTSPLRCGWCAARRYAGGVVDEDDGVETTTRVYYCCCYWLLFCLVEFALEVVDADALLVLLVVFDPLLLGEVHIVELGAARGLHREASLHTSEQQHAYTFIFYINTT
eukprot:GEZU01029763.1.p2 GENE.GEZU01029763.1~~GEZU01029763.1.p2  ORF type:complete len:133 (-),score=3.64 GEZU01029763.1:84-482(-)